MRIRNKQSNKNNLNYDYGRKILNKIECDNKILKTITIINNISNEDGFAK